MAIKAIFLSPAYSRQVKQEARSSVDLNFYRNNSPGKINSHKPGLGGSFSSSMAFWMLAGHYSQHKRCSTHPIYLSKLTGDQKGKIKLNMVHGWGR
jgi:hypothetical protein